ncbi:diguanylate cyclase [Prosthecomicrobium hirschii]|uniref:GGDEF domain-containing response regulator n=1 Tax=Prosthecodimorpha hirschii TaxID=665126 RepID=UPI00221ECE82|nr:diguanylate cyclase [Prosthecomicrobium hirschii]MCW1843463.1 diguanylate cyclase [Prosthecomicrobium hirschii]
MRIVVADASRVVLKIMIKLLTDHGHVAFGFTTGEEALAKLVEDPSVDVLITSLELSGMSGFELCWECRVMTKREQQLYILAMSSLAAHERLAEALDSGADDFIGKPPNPEELFARLRAAERFAMTQRQLVRLATRDTLTGLLNRRAFFESAETLAERRGDQPVAVLIADIDWFKRINDTHGHDAGDQVIAAVAERINLADAVVGRIGGEEYALVVREGRPSRIWEIADGLRRAVGDTPVQTSLSTIPVTISVGTAILQPDETVDTALRRADAALYMAKRAGRNRIVAADGEQVVPLPQVTAPMIKTEVTVLA